MFRLQDKVPSPYIEQSRDFQLLARINDAVISGIRFKARTIQSLINTDSCPAEMLPLLKTKLGFYTNKRFLDDELREILKAFPYLIKWKGSKRAIKSAVYLFLRAMKIHTESSVVVNNTDYTITVKIKSSVIDTSILDELFRYILPVGYQVTYIFYKPVKEDRYGIALDEVNVISNLGDMTNAQLRSTGFDIGMDIASDSIPDRLIGGVDTGYIAGTAYQDTVAQQSNDQQ